MIYLGEGGDKPTAAKPLQTGYRIGDVDVKPDPKNYMTVIEKKDTKGQR